MFARVFSALFVVLLSFSIAGCGNNKQAPQSSFVLIDGSTLTTQDLKGKVTLINFWATTCVSCVKEMPLSLIHI